MLIHDKSIKGNNHAPFWKRNKINKILVRNRKQAEVDRSISSKISCNSHQSSRMQEVPVMGSIEARAEGSCIEHEIRIDQGERETVEAVYQDDTSQQRLLSPNEGRDPRGSIPDTLDSTLPLPSLSISAR